jgi:PKD repeat protein
MKTPLYKCLILFFLTLSIVSCKKEKEDEPEIKTPVANFTYGNSPVKLGIKFNNTSTDASEYSWVFGDGTSSTDTNPTHSYAENGTYTVTLTATNGSKTNSISISVIVSNSKFFKAEMYGSGNYFLFSDAEPTAIKSSSDITITAYSGSQMYTIKVPLTAYTGVSYLTSNCVATISYTDNSGELSYGNCTFSCYYVNITLTEVTSGYLRGTLVGNLVKTCSPYTGFTIQSGSFAAEFQ